MAISSQGYTFNVGSQVEAGALPVTVLTKGNAIGGIFIMLFAVVWSGAALFIGQGFFEPDLFKFPTCGQVRGHGPGFKGRFLRASRFVLNCHEAGMPGNEVIPKTSLDNFLAKVLAGVFVAKRGLKVRGIQAE